MVTNFALDADCVGMHSSMPPLCREERLQGDFCTSIPGDAHRHAPLHTSPQTSPFLLLPADPCSFHLQPGHLSACSETGNRHCSFHLGHRQLMWGETVAQWELLLLLPSLPDPSPANHPHPHRHWAVHAARNRCWPEGKAGAVFAA